MKWVLCVVSILSLVLLESAALDSSNDNALCEDGWTYFQGTCYVLRTDYEKMSTAYLNCALMGGELAYARDEESLNLLTRMVKKRAVFGWWYGAGYDRLSNDVLLRGDDGHFSVKHSEKRGNALPYPPAKMLSAPTDSSACIAFSPSVVTYITPRQPIMMSLSCSVTLPYICRGDQTTEVTDGSHYAKNSSLDVYWFSSPTDRRTYEAASIACKAKSMTLLSIRDANQKDFINLQAMNRSLHNIDPWWIGLQVNKDGSYAWTSNVFLYNDVLNWQQLAPGTRWYADTSILLSDGTNMQTRRFDGLYAPYMCMKSQLALGEYGCPHSWSRAGQSCYKKIAKYVTQVDSEKACSKMGSHLVSIDSDVEKIWLKGSIVDTSSVWISLHDKQKTGSFVWADGSKPKSSVLGWVQAFSRYGKCATFSTFDGSVSRSICKYASFPGCQYIAPLDGKCVSKDWVNHKGNCYYKPKLNRSEARKYKRPYETMLHFCNADVAKYDASIKVTPLKIDTKELVTFFKDFNKNYLHVWLGMSMRDDGTIKWADGTIVDHSFFKTSKQPDTGKPKNPKHCVYMGSDGSFRTASCQLCHCAHTVCEKEIPFMAGDGAILTSHLLMTICACLVTLYKYL